MENRSTNLPDEKKIRYRITWTYNFNLFFRGYTFETDEFNSPFHENCYWKLDVHWINFVVHINLRKLSPEIVVDDFDGTITLLRGNRKQKFPFTYDQTCNQQISFSGVGDSFKTFSNFQLSIDMWLTSASAVSQLPNNKIHTLSQDMKQLLFANDFSDVVLEVEGQEIPAHKNILAARSSVFMAMFKSGMQEDQISRVKITDIRIEDVREMLRYAYTGQIGQPEINASDLMIAADKYNMSDLKKKCRDWLCTKLNKDVAAATLICADFLRDDSLKTVTIDFVASNLSEVMQTPEWGVIKNDHPSLIYEILEGVARQNVRKEERK